MFLGNIADNLTVAPIPVFSIENIDIMMETVRGCDLPAYAYLDGAIDAAARAVKELPA